MAYGIVNADQIGTSVQGYSLGAGNSSLLKNKIINGACVIDQRNAGASVTPVDGAYTLDRWTFNLAQASKLTCQQNAGSVTPPVGFSNYLGLTSTSAYSVTSTDSFDLDQFVEGFNSADLNWGTANAKTVTLSFQVYSSLTGTFGGVLQNSANNYTYPFSYSIPVANTWTSISITVAGPTSGTWIGATNGAGIRLRFSMGAGSSRTATAGSWTATSNIFGATGQTSVVGTSGATFYITGVQLEVGSSATGFEYRQYGQELALCQRYYGRFQGSGAVINSSFSTGMSQTTGQAVYTIQFPQTMRTLPTLSVNQLASSDATNYDSIISGIAAQYNCTTNSRVAFTSAATMTPYRPAFLIAQSSTNGYIDFSAEL